MPVTGEPRGTLTVLIGVSALVALVSSLGAPLIPSVAETDHVSLSSAQWVLTAALMTGALATPAMGRLADGPHKRRVIEFALAVALLGCVLSAVSTGFVLLVVGRGLQGVGLGLLPVTMAIARSLFPPLEAGRAIAILSVSAAVGAGLGYPVTALIAQFFNFRAAFGFGAVVVALTLVFVVVVLPRRYAGEVRPFDLVGMATLGAAVVGISVVLSEGGTWGWGSARSVALFALSAVTLLAWLFHELRTVDPLIDVRQMRNRSVVTADAAGFLIASAMYMFLPIVIEFVQVPPTRGYGFGASVVVSGLVFVPLSVGSFAASRLHVAYSRRFGARSMIPFGSLLFGASAFFFFIEHGALWEAFVASGIAGVGMGFTFAAMPGFIVRAVPPSETGSALGLYQVLRSIGLSLGSALASALLLSYTARGQTYPSYNGFGVTLAIAGALCVLTAVLSYLLPGRSAQPGRPSPDVEMGETAEMGEMGEMMTEVAEVEGVGLMLAEGPLESGLHRG